MGRFTVLAALAIALVAGCGLTNKIRERVAPPTPSAAALAALDAPILPAFNYAPFSADALRSHIERLASDEFEGRAPGTNGERLTIDYISRAFEAAGLEAGVRQSRNRATWLQDVPLSTSEVTNNPALVVNAPDGAHSYAYGDQFVVWTRRVAPNVFVDNAELVFVGYGVVSPELGWNDYAGLDMHGKIAVILINDPDFETGDDRGFRGKAMTYYGRWTYKFEEAARQGAAGAIIIHQTAPAAYPWGVVQSSWTGEQHDIVRDDGGASRTPFESWITEAAARDIFARAGLDLDAEKHRAQRPDFTPITLNQSASVHIEQTRDLTVSHNVVGLLRGRSHPNETVIYTAHWDHLGHCPPIDGDGICNGALDNATGVAGLIELARRFVNAGRADRSVVFMAVTAEESGLLGSAYYADHPLFAPALTAAEINMDGLNVNGPARDITIVGSAQNDLEQRLAAAAFEQGRRVSPEPFPERGSFFRSDHFNFARIGVPALYTGAGIDLYDGGRERGEALQQDYVQNRYHKPGDEITPNWDFVGAIRDLMLLEQVGRGVADSSDWPQWSARSEFASIRAVSNAQRRH